VGSGGGLVGFGGKFWSALKSPLYFSAKAFAWRFTGVREGGFRRVLREVGDYRRKSYGAFRRTFKGLGDGS
jgi:hypothetical protein